MPNTPMSAVFDTAFHQTMPEKAFLYAVSMKPMKNMVFGVMASMEHPIICCIAGSQLLNRPIESLKIITCHLGNGSSITAVQNGKSIDTSMGFTPLEGVPMGTRSGNIDPAIISYMMEKQQLTSEEVNETLNKRSGVLGLSGVSSDFRDLSTAAEKGVRRAKIALDVFIYQVEKFIGAYAAAMGGIDCIVFTAGIGENTPEIREGVCSDLAFMGVKIDKERNVSIPGMIKEGFISTDDSKVAVLVVPTNEELMIVRETMELL